MLALFNFNNAELLLMLVVVLILFGGKKIPELARGLGKGVSEFKKGVREIESEVVDAASTSPAAPVQQNQQTPVAAVSASPQPFRFDPYTGKPLETQTPVASANKPQ